MMMLTLPVVEREKKRHIYRLFLLIGKKIKKALKRASSSLLNGVKVE